jgi:hypothetical protein
MFRRISDELKEHAPFTTLGAVTGIIMMVIVVWVNVTPEVSSNIFYILHPVHVLLSAMVTTSVYMKYRKGKVWEVILVGYIGAVGIATVSDSLIPYLGEVLLELPNRGAHVGFIEKWWLVNPLALIGVAIGYLRPTTKLPHWGHVLISTWASSFHVVMALGVTVSWITGLVIFLFLFFAVWIPCCLSDIVFPLLFIRKGLPPRNA